MTTVRFPIEAGHIMTFARALGDPNPVYHDEAYARASPCGGIVPPPTFVIAAAQFDPEFGARPRPGRPWKGSGREPSGDPESLKAGGTGLYAEQHFEFHHPVHPGDLLTGEARPGREWEKRSRRAGTLKFNEVVTEWRNQHGQRVITARKVIVFTSHNVAQD